MNVLGTEDGKDRRTGRKTAALVHKSARDTPRSLSSFTTGPPEKAPLLMKLTAHSPKSVSKLPASRSTSLSDHGDRFRREHHCGPLPAPPATRVLSDSTGLVGPARASTSAMAKHAAPPSGVRL